MSKHIETSMKPCPECSEQPTCPIGMRYEYYKSRSLLVGCDVGKHKPSQGTNTDQAIVRQGQGQARAQEGKQ